MRLETPPAATANQRHWQVAASLAYDYAAVLAPAADRGLVCLWQSGDPMPVVGRTADELSPQGGPLALLSPTDRDRLERRLREDAALREIATPAEGGPESGQQPPPADARDDDASTLCFSLDLPHREPGLRWAEVRVQFDYAADGRRLCYAALISRRCAIAEPDHAQAAAALRESEARFRQLAENVDECFWIADWRQQSVVYVNPAFERITGIPSEAILRDATLFLTLCHPDDAPRIVAAFVEAPEKGGYREEYRIRGSDGQWHWIYENCYALRDESGEVHRLVGVSKDVSAWKQAEAELQKRQAELAHVSRCTTIGQLVAGIIHDLSQPVSAASNFATACLQELRRPAEELQPALLARWVGQVAEQTGRARDILQRLSGFLRRTQPEEGPIDVNDLVRQSARLMGSELRQRGVLLNLDLATDLPPIWGDAVQLQQVLVNLLLNACEALENVPSERRAIRVDSCRTTEGVAVTVTDSGPGVPEIVAETMFQAFVSTKSAGMGMGLAICDYIVRSHGGAIDYASANGSPAAPVTGEFAGGAAFRFTLPLR